VLSTDKVLVTIGTLCSLLLGERAVGVPTLRRLDPDLGSAAELFNLQSSSVAGDNDGGALCSTQGFGGYNGAIALRVANDDSLARYEGEPRVFDAYLERWPEIRREREQRERRWRSDVEARWNWRRYIGGGC
jgi:3-oxoacyl-[acyl-carrier-protein] synthase II